MSTHEELVRKFDRMVARDGGAVRLVSDDGTTLRVAYTPGVAGPDCTDDVCVLPEQELAQLMGEALARRSPGTRLEVEVAS